MPQLTPPTRFLGFRSPVACGPTCARALLDALGLLFIHAARSASPLKRCLRCLFRFIFPAIPEIRSYPMLAAGLGNIPTPQTFLENLPLLFRTAFHLRFTTHAASWFGGPYPTLGRCPVLEGSSTTDVSNQPTNFV